MSIVEEANFEFADGFRQGLEFILEELEKELMESLGHVPLEFQNGHGSGIERAISIVEELIEKEDDS